MGRQKQCAWSPNSVGSLAAVVAFHSADKHQTIATSFPLPSSTANIVLHLNPPRPPTTPHATKHVES